MKFSLDKQKHFSILTLMEKNLNSLISPDLKSEFVFFHNEGVNNLILDLSGVDYVDSSGLSAILTANRLWKLNGTFVLTGIVSESVKKLIAISRLDTILNIIPTLEEAKEFVMMEEIEREITEEE